MSDTITDEHLEGEVSDEQGEAARALEWRRSKAQMLEKLTEHRNVACSGVEIRALDSGTLQLTGYASVYDVDYDMGWYQERVAPGAGKRTLGESPDVQLLLNHESLPLARTASGTLRLSEDARGLYVEADLDPDDPDVQQLVRKNRRGDLDQMSFAFRTLQDEWNEDYTHRTIQQYSLHRGDVSVVNYGANPATQVSVRSQASVKALDGVISVLESRAGKTLSAATMETLTQVLRLVATADDAVDEAQPLLADLMGVENPDEDESDDSTESEDTESESEGRAPVTVPDYTTRARQQLLVMRGRR